MIEAIRRYPYRKKSDLCNELGLSRTFVYERCREIEEEYGRYGDYAVIHDGNITLINVLAFLDYMKHRRLLRSDERRRYVPRFDPEKIARQMGWKGVL